MRLDIATKIVPPAHYEAVAVDWAYLWLLAIPLPLLLVLTV